MLCAIRKSDGQTVTAYLERKENGPFRCPECGDPVILKAGRNHLNHFAHDYPLARHYAESESDAHRRCKMEIYEALLKQPGVRKAALERPQGTNRPDVSAYINGVPVAIEVQISSLSLETITQRTIEYARKGIYVLWLLQWTPALDTSRYTPKHWEKWIHAAYFGRVYYWKQGLTVVSYHFDPNFKSVPKKTWYSENGKQMTSRGYSRRSKRYRTPVRGKTFKSPSSAPGIGTGGKVMISPFHLENYTWPNSRQRLMVSRLWPAAARAETGTSGLRTHKTLAWA